MRVPFRVLLTRAPCYFGDPQTDANLENYPTHLGFEVHGSRFQKPGLRNMEASGIVQCRGLNNYKRRVCLTSVGENTYHPSVDAVSRNYKSAARIHISRFQSLCRRCVLVSKSRKLKFQERPPTLGFHVLFIAF